MNFKNLTYKKKLKVLWIGATVFLLFLYNFVLSRTIDEYVLNQELKKKIEEGQKAPERKSLLEEKAVRFDNSLNKYFSDSIKNREYLLAVVSQFCQKNKLLLQDFPNSYLSSEKDFDIETNVVVAEGNFLNLLRLVYELEQKIKIARPASVCFEKKFDNKRKREVLTVSIYLQNIRMNKNEIAFN